jgi:Replication initiator protein A
MLLPERHPVRDFFVLDVHDVDPRSDLASMEHPIFSLSTAPDKRPLKYAHGDVTVEIIPSYIGLPTVFDKDVLIYCISKLVAMRDKGEQIGRCVRLTTHDLLVNTNRPTNDLGYKRLAPALDRLAGTRIKTNIKTGDEETTRGFGLIDAYEYNRKGSMFADRLRFLEIELSDWMFRAVQAAEVLPISRDYFRLRRPTDRRLYELARKHCGKQDKWLVSVGVLQKKVGVSQDRPRAFRQYLRSVIDCDELPDYRMAWDGDNVAFMPRKKALQPKLPDIVGNGRRILLPSWALERMHEVAAGWDKYMLEAKYKEWAADLEVANDEGARFVGWVKSYTKGKKAP